MTNELLHVDKGLGQSETYYIFKLLNLHTLIMTTVLLMKYFILPAKKKSSNPLNRYKDFLPCFPFDMLNIHFNIHKRNFSLNFKKYE